MKSSFVKREIILRQPSASDRFTPEDRALGTLSLNFVDPPEITLSLDFLSQSYKVWVDDTTIPGLVGSYKIKA